MKPRRSERGAPIRRCAPRRVTRVVLLAVSLAVHGTGTAAAQGASNAGAAGLLLPIGARTTALGGAGAGDPDAADALFTNPAVYAAKVRGDIGLEYGQDESARRYSLGLAYPLPLVGTLSLSVYQQDLATVPRVTRAGEEIGTL